MKLAAIIFDMDGVLINSEPLWMQAEVEVFNKVGLNLTNTDCEKTRGVRIKNVVEHYYLQQPWKSPAVDEVILAITDRVVELIYEKGQALDGLFDCLKLLFELNIPLGIATSSSEKIITAVINKLKIEKYFSVIQSADTEIYGKPHPAVYLNCAAMLNANPVNCIAVEDSITGVIAAKAARMKVVAIPEPAAFNDPRFSIADLKLNSLHNFTEAVILKLENQSMY